MPSEIGQPPPVNPKEVEWLKQEKHHGQETGEFLADVERLTQGEPLAYIIGWVPFYGCKIDVSLHPMIPRPETEFWVERAVQELRNTQKTTLRLADTFSGSGCIGVALAKHLPHATVELSEYDHALIPQIEKNITANGVARRASVTQADALGALTGTYDAIFANPPYIDPESMEDMDRSVTHYEPHLSLFAGERGLDFIKLIIQNGGAFLNPGGTFYIECDAHQREWIDELMSAYLTDEDHTPWKHEFWFDQYEQVRFLILRLPA
jgi:release factor glutamine methyltransferase